MSTVYPKPVVYFDLDGVFADFVGGQHAAHHAFDYDIFNYPYKLGEWDIFKLDDCPMTWESANNKSVELFWANLHWMPEAQVLYTRLMEKLHLNSISILTKPMMNIESYSGKARWVRHHMKPLFTKLIMTHKSKGDLVQGNSSALLIDDIDKNVDSFIKAGGHAILVPRPWNRKHALFSKDDVGNDHVLHEVDKWMRIEGYRREDYV